MAVGSPLIDVSPLAGLKRLVAQEASPRRPVFGEQRYGALKGVAGKMPDGFELALHLACATGHRIGAITGLR